MASVPFSRNFDDKNDKFLTIKNRDRTDGREVKIKIKSQKIKIQKVPGILK